MSQTLVRAMIILGLFLGCYYLPVEQLHLHGALLAAFALVRWYAREHVILCLVPAFLIAGAVSVFISKASVMRYFGAGANRFLAYGVASVSGTVLAVCSCTVLPLFAGIYKRGAGLGPAIAFLYSGPAISVLAIIMTARVLGLELGLARALSAILFSALIGLLMHLIFRKDEAARGEGEGMLLGEESAGERPLWVTAVYFAAMVGVLVFANWARPDGPGQGIWSWILDKKWLITLGLLALLAAVLKRWFTRVEIREWVGASWEFAQQILPLLLIGVLVSGLLLGGEGHAGLIPASFVASLVGDNSIFSSLFASFVGALMYFATLTEVPIIQGLMGSGMARGPALALLLAGPALSLPSLLIIRTVIGVRKTLVYAALVVALSAVMGVVFGLIAH